MSRRWPVTRLLLLLALALVLAAVQSCAPAMSPTRAPAAAEPSATQASAEQPGKAAQATRAAQATQPPALTAEEKATQESAKPTLPPLIEGRLVELEWPEHLRMGESDVIRLALVATKEGYVARAEFPNHDLQTKEVPVPRPNGYELFAVARLDGVGFDIAPTGEQERFVPAGEEVAWRWTLSARKPGQQRLSIQLRLRWVPAPGVTGSLRESQAYARGIDVQVTSFLGLSPAQAGSTGLIGLLMGSGLLLVAVVWRGSPTRAMGKVDAIQPAEPNLALEIEAPPGLNLTAEEGALLRALFQKYRRLVIENEFLSGYSGARTFLVRPIRPDDCADALTIVKLGPRPSIQREYENYDTFVKDRLPPMTARIQRAPVSVGRSGSGSKANEARQLAAVQYTFIAEPGHAPVSLRRALLEHPEPAYLLRLFETFGPNWWMQRRPATFRLGQEYDALLPPHYVLEPLWDARHSDGPTLCEKDDPALLHLAVGSLVTVNSFQQAELRADGRSLSLAAYSQPGRPALRLRWLNTRPPAGTPARVTAARLDLLHAWTSDFDRFGLPDPLDALPALLEETITGTRSVIHGDLNLENILVGPGNLVWLIDFAQTREGHPLYDFAHLESELIAHVLTPRSGSPRAYLDLWRSGNDPLLNALHGIAARCLFDSARPREYHLALALACLGALKYPNLSTPARHCLYLTAAHLAQE